ncbi:MAG: phage terminase large subunit family protein [Limisphaerales bacterium]
MTTIQNADQILLANTQNPNAIFVGNAKIRPTTFLLKDQARWAADDCRFKFCVKSRQIGWTYGDGYGNVVRSAYSAQPIETFVSSRDESLAQNYLRNLRFFAQRLSLKLENHGDLILGDRLGNANCIEFANGSRIHSLSSNPDAQAGKSGNRVLDEFALHPDQEKLYSIAVPGTMWGGSLSIFSTPRGTSTLFHRLMMDIEHNGNPRGFSYYKITFQNFLEQGGLYKIQSQLPPNDPIQQMDEADFFNFKKRESIDEETFNQEYMCVSTDEAAAFLSYDLITAAEYAHGIDWEKPANTTDPELYVGVDIGRDKDRTVIWLLEKSGSTYYTREVEVMENQPFEKQEAVLYELLAMPQVKRCCIDQTGIGRQFTERAQQKFGKYKVEGVTFTQAMKEELAYPVRMAFEDRTIKIPNDPKIRADLRAIKKEPTSSGNVRFTADRSASGHSDGFWALALAVRATKQKHQPLEITIGY